MTCGNALFESGTCRCEICLSLHGTVEMILGNGGMKEAEHYSDPTPSAPSLAGTGDDVGLEARAGDDDTPLTDALLDQFSAYYLVAVLAVRALEEARRQRAFAEAG